MRSVLLVLALIFMASGQSQEIKKPIPPISGKAKDADKSNDNAAQKQSVSIELPATINVNVGGKLDTSATETKKQADTEASKWTDPISIATWLLAFITAGLVIVGYLQVRTTRRQLRAYISILPGFLLEQNLRDPTAFFEARPIIKNTGQTPAGEVIYTGITRILPAPLPANFNFSLAKHPMPSVSTLGPGQQMELYPHTEKIYSTDELIVILTVKGHALHTYGVVTYKDIFNKKWQTHFNYWFMWGNKGFPIWLLHNQNNKAT